MAADPHSAICHNLMGILMENENEHVLAMKHFRAAYALDSTYIPARLNMEIFGQDYPLKHLVYSEDDCSKYEDDQFKVVYDNKHVGHLVRK